MWIMAAGAVIGGVDKIFGNRLGLGKRFEEGFLLLGTTALSMAGIICLTPLLSMLLKAAVVPLCDMSGLDPGILGGILAIDMGGYQLSMELAGTPDVGRYAGIIVGATFGCTITFTIPVGMGMISGVERPLFAKGMLIGLGMMPVSLLLGGLFCGLRVTEVLCLSLPVFALSLMLMAGIRIFCGRDRISDYRRADCRGGGIYDGLSDLERNCSDRGGDGLGVLHRGGAAGESSCGGIAAADPGKTAELDRKPDRDEWEQRGRASHGNRQPGPCHCHDEGNGRAGEGGERCLSGVRSFRAGGAYGIRLWNGAGACGAAPGLQAGGGTVRGGGGGGAQQEGMILQMAENALTGFAWILPTDQYNDRPEAEMHHCIPCETAELLPDSAAIPLKSLLNSGANRFCNHLSAI